jgi:hypothetical protein
VFTNNTSTLTAYLYNADDSALIPQGDITSVVFTVLKPGDDPNTPTIDAQAGVLVGDGAGQYVVPASVNDTAGHYLGIAVFTYNEGALTGLVKTVPVNYDCVDAFHLTGPSLSDVAVDMAWLKFEDCFDSEDGGVWLRDMTMARFDKDKIKAFVPTVLMEINAQMPQTSYTESTYPYNVNDGNALMAQGLLVETIRHLMRSYTEQPDVMNSPVGFFDRKRYQQAWASIYQIELEQWRRYLELAKLRLFDATGSSMLLSQKAGRLLPAPLRTRGAYRGFY